MLLLAKPSTFISLIYVALWPSSRFNGGTAKPHGDLNPVPPIWIGMIIIIVIQPIVPINATWQIEQKILFCNVHNITFYWRQHGHRLLLLLISFICQLSANKQSSPVHQSPFSVIFRFPLCVTVIPLGWLALPPPPPPDEQNRQTATSFLLLLLLLFSLSVSQSF